MKKKERLIYLHQYFNKRMESGSIRSDIISDCFVQTNLRVLIVTSDRKAKKLRIERYRRKIIVWFPIGYDNSFSYYRRVFAFLNFIFSASLFTFKYKCKIVYATSTPLTVFIPAFIAKFKYKSVLIAEIRDQWPYVPIGLGLIKGRFLKWFLKWFEKTVYRNATEIIALSPGMKKGINKVYGGKEPVVVPNMAPCLDSYDLNNTGYRLIKNIKKNKYVVIYPGTIGYVNSYEYLVQLAEVLNNTDFILIVVGSGKYKKMLELEARKRKIYQQTIFILDTMDKTEILGAIKASDYVISTVVDNPVMWANSANKVFDAFSCGKPILINHEGWLADLIRQHDIGLVLGWDFERSRDRLISARSVLYRQQEENVKHIAASIFSEEVLVKKIFNVINNYI